MSIAAELEDSEAKLQPRNGGKTLHFNPYLWKKIQDCLEFKHWLKHRNPKKSMVNVKLANT